MQFPVNPPEQSFDNLWLLQQELMELAEKIFGPRDTRAIILPPSFDDDGPHIRYIEGHYGAGAKLSPNAKLSWHIALYELAHETVHLLKPEKRRYGTWLEEGIAVVFSVEAQAIYQLPPISPTLATYREAFSLAWTLPDGPFKAGKVIREKLGGFSEITAEQLMEIFPGAEVNSLRRLSEICIPR